MILDSKNHIIKVHTVYVGSLNSAIVRVAELFREATLAPAQTAGAVQVSGSTPRP